MEELEPLLSDSRKMFDELGLPLTQEQLLVLEKKERKKIEAQMFPELKVIVEEKTSNFQGEIHFYIHKGSDGNVVIKSMFPEDETEEGKITFGNFTLDCTERKLIHPDKTWNLKPKEFQLLKLLLDNKNQLVSREEITKAVWDDQHNPNSRVMDMYYKTLRQYLLFDCRDNLKPMGPRQRNLKFKSFIEPEVEICKIYGAGYMLKILNVCD
jgi:hypothetical protein